MLSKKFSRCVVLSVEILATPPSSSDHRDERRNTFGDLCKTVGLPARGTLVRANLAEQCSALRRTAPFAEVSCGGVSLQRGPRLSACWEACVCLLLHKISCVPLPAFICPSSLLCVLVITR